MATRAGIRPSVAAILTGVPLGVGAAALTGAFEPFLAHNLFLVFLLATLIASLTGGLASGLAATMAGTLGFAALVFEPAGSLAVATHGDRVRAAALVAFGALIAGLGEALLAARRRARAREASLAESEASYRALFTSMAEAVYVLDPSGAVVEANPAACRLHGTERDGLVGATLEELSDPSRVDFPGERHRIRRAFEGESQRLEWWGRRRNGESFPLEIGLTAGRYFGRDVVFVVARDLTERNRLEDQLRQAQKMEAVGRLAGGIAHDFNNVLTTIHGRASLLLEELGSGDERAEDAEEIVRAAGLATRVTRELLTFARGGGDEGPGRAELNPVIRSFEKMLRRVIGEDIEIVLDLSDDVGAIPMSPHHLEQVVLNLVVNARDAMPDGGTITVTTSPTTLDPSPPGRGAADGLRSGVRLSVADTGVGMDPEIVPRIFEPFYTTKPEGQGTGLGLSTVYGIVQRHGGRIQVRSEPGRGTTFHVGLPLADGRPASHGAAPAADAPPTWPTDGPAAASGTILVVEDQAPVRELVRKILTRRGFQVVTAADGMSAHALIEAGLPSLELAITDVVLPDAGGAEVADRVWAVDPTVPVLFMSGHPRRDALGEADHGGPAAFLAKPFTPAALVAAVDDLLDGRSRVDGGPARGARAAAG